MRNFEVICSKLKYLCGVLISDLVICWYLDVVCIEPQLGQPGSDGVAGVRDGSVGAGGVGQGVGQRGPLPRQAGLELPRPVLKHLQGGADVLQGLLGFPHG